MSVKQFKTWNYQSTCSDYPLDFLEGSFDNIPTAIVDGKDLITVAKFLRDDPRCHFDTFIDTCVVDYLDYGLSEWTEHDATASGFCRAKQPSLGKEAATENMPNGVRFVVVVHLLSTKHNHRVRLRIPQKDDKLECPSLVPVWPAANWFEREAFDLFGVFFNGHPDLRRILTDYGFKGHPFRKDFPLVGEVEMRYDATLQRCVYEPVSIKPRVQTPKVIRVDPRDQIPDDGEVNV